MSGSPQQPQYQSLYRACIKDAAAAGADLMQATLERALRELPGMAARIVDVVDRNLSARSGRCPEGAAACWSTLSLQALLAEFAQAIAGGRSSAFSFDSLPLLGDEQLQENADLVRGAQELAAVRPELAQLEAMLAATSRRAASRPHPAPEVYVRSIYRLVRQSPVSPAVRRRWLRHLPPLMAPNWPILCRDGPRLQAGAALRGRTTWAGPGEQAGAGPRHPAHHPRTAQAGRGTRGTTPANRFQRERVSHTVPAALEMVQDMRKVDQLLLQLRQRQAAIGRARQPGGLREALRQEARRPRRRSAWRSCTS